MTGDKAVSTERGERVLRNAGVIPDAAGTYAPLIPLTSELLTQMQDTLGPVFREVADQNAPHRTREGDGWDGSIGDNCPVQGFGTVDGARWYFRARYDAWSFGVGATDDDAVAGTDFEVEGPYGTPGGYEAGWMPYAEAWPLIEAAIAAYRERQH